MVQLVHAFITRRIDYCKSLLYELPNNVVSKLQRDQNVPFRLVIREFKIYDATVAKTSLKIAS